MSVHPQIAQDLAQDLAQDATGRSGDTMRAAVIVAPRTVEIHEVAIPQPGPGAIRVRLEGCGVCASNIPPWEGRPWFEYPMEPGQLGHEGWGTVDAVGEDVTAFEPGDRVTLISGHAYAEYDVAPQASAVRIPDALRGRPVPGEPLGCAVNILRRSDIQPGQQVAIVGVGFLGALLTQLASSAGAHVIAISRRPFALEVARRAGAAEILSAAELDDDAIVERVEALTEGALCDRVIEATGKQASLTLAAKLTRERGRLIVAGYHQDGLREIDMQLWNWRGLDVINAHERDPEIYRRGMKAALLAVEAGALDPEPLYTHTFPLAELGAALDAVRERPDGFLKALVTFDG